jgi:hypothetical protein
MTFPIPNQACLDRWVQHVRSLPCLACTLQTGGNDPHHLLRTPDGRGMAQKSPDYWRVPLCRPCHSKLHERGNEKLFFFRAGVDPVLWVAKHYPAFLEGEGHAGG